LSSRGVGVDVVHPSTDLSAYRLVVVPTLYLVDDATVAALTAAAEAGATVVITYFSGIVDEHDHIRLGGYPGAFRDLLGIRVEEFLPLPAGERVRLTDGTESSLWVEHLHLAGAEAVVGAVDGPMPGVPVVTRHEVGQGRAWYAATRLDPEGTDALVERLLADAGIAHGPAQPGVEVLRRTGAEGRSFAFCINHTAEPATVAVAGRDLLSGESFDGTVDPGAVAVVVEEA
jgi:beta-galactosidase